LTFKAQVLIRRLAGELQYLTHQAERDLKRASPKQFCFDISLMLKQLHRDWLEGASVKGLRFEVIQKDVIVKSERRLLRVIINNIVGNAVRYTDFGEVRVDSTIEDRHLVVAVRDTGPGISESALRHAFGHSPLDRGESVEPGQGLSIARRTADLLRHAFVVKSTPNQGTCVLLYIPLALKRRMFMPAGACGFGG
jgi:signal transduction histidine kinase